MTSIQRLMALALTALALAGCGGGGSSTTSTAPLGAASNDAAPTPSSAATVTDASDALSQNSTQQPLDVQSFTDSGDIEVSVAEPTQAALDDDRPTASVLAVSSEQPKKALAVADGSANVKSNFDTSFKSLAPGWSINWWGTSSPSLAANQELRAGYVVAGAGSQHYRLNSVAPGGGAHLIYSYGFVKDRSYVIAINVRSEMSTQVEFQFRRNGSPYNTVAVKRVTVGPAWQRIELQGVYGWADAGALRVVPLSMGADIYLDEMSITTAPLATAQTLVTGGIDVPAAGGSAVSLTALKTSDMESNFSRYADGWYSNSFGGASGANIVVARESRADHVHSGSGSQLFQVINKNGGDVQLTYAYPFARGKTYHATLYLRADVPTPVQVFIRMDAPPWQPIASTTVTLDTNWQKIDLQGAYSADASGSVRIALLNATGTVWVDDLTLSEVNQNDMAPVSTATIPDTLFGMHVNQLGVHHNWPGMGTKIMRLWNTGTTWRDIQKTKGVWDFSTGGGLRLDKYVAYISKSDPQASILYTLGQTPQWASSTPTVPSAFGLGAGGAPADMDDWRAYVRTLARRYAGRIRYWELWNEPDFIGTYNGTTANLVEMARIAKEELVAADPNNKLVSPGFTVGQGMAALNAFLLAGGGAHSDIIGFHFYYSTNPESIRVSMDNVRGIMKTLGQDAKPLWNTEGAFVCNPAVADCLTAKPTPAESRSVNARAMFIMAAKGIGNFNFHVWEATDAFRQLVQADYVTPTEAATAFTEARTWIKGARVVDAYRIDEQVYVLRMNRGTENFVILWSTQANTVVNLPSAWTVGTVRSITGAESPIPASRQITLTIEPVLLK